MSECPAICTIIAKNYVAFARTLCGSFLSQHPDGRCYVLIVDDWEGFINPAKEKFEIISLRQLEIPNVREWCFKYDVTELSTAVKPAFLTFLLRERNAGRVLYLDPDILVTRPLAGLYSRLEDADVVVTPHLDTDFPEDGHLPDDALILKTGVFNLGFIGVSSGAARFLHWWGEKLTDKCLDDTGRGYFVDQKFVDLAITLFDGFHIERDVGYNAAYWNLHSRRIGRDDAGEWTCNGGPLYFYHFSGYKADRPEAVSVYSHRHRMADRPDIQPLFAEYGRRVMENAYAATRVWPYSFRTFDSGETILGRTRRHYLNTPDRGRVYGDPFCSEQLKRHSRRIARVRQVRRFFTGANRAARRVVGRLVGEGNGRAG